jgi:pimeloyl-ACP methyl ester carboxylesterase
VTVWSLAAKVAGAVGAAVGVAAVGAGAGLAAERATVGRRPSRDDPYLLEDFTGPGDSVRVVEADDGVQLHAEVDEPERWPPGPRLTVVLSHGYALNLDTWHLQRRELADLGRLVLWDQRSHGRSGRSDPEHVSVAQLGRDLGRIVAELAPDGPLVLVAHSMGGMGQLALARQRPELFRRRVCGVGLVCTSAGGLDRATFGVPGPFGRLAHRVGPGVVATLARQPDIVERSRQAGSDLGFVLTKRWSFASDVPPSLVDLVAQMNAATPIEVIAAFLPIFGPHDEHSALPILDGIEGLVVGAVQDRIVPVEHARDISRALPLAEYLELDPCGHMAMLEYPDLLTEHLRALVGRAARTARADVA